MAYIFLFSLTILGSYPLVQEMLFPLEQSISDSDACCCDQAQDGCCEMPSDQDEENNSDCGSACDCQCQLHLNALHFQFNTLQLTQEQEYHYGEYINVYSFEYFSLHIPPPRLG